MTISIKPTASGSTIEQDGSTVLSIESDRSVDVDSGTLHVDATNNRVGIGTSSPSEPLSVFRTGGQEEGINIRNTSSGNGSRLTFETTRSDDSSVQDMAAIQVYAIAGYDSAANSDAIMTFQTQNSGTTAEQMRLDNVGNLKFNSGYGSVVTAYGCRAWVNFDGTGTVTIRDSGNVSSVTDSGVGIYIVNYSVAMPDANYAATVSSGGTTRNASVTALTTSSCTNRLRNDAGSYADANMYCVIHR